MDFDGVEAPPPSDGLKPEDIKFIRSLRTSATGPSSDGEAGERLGGIARRLSSRTVKKLEVASDEIELQPGVWDSALFQFASVSGRGASVFTLVLLVVNILRLPAGATAATAIARSDARSANRRRRRAPRTRRPSGCGKGGARATARACLARSSWTSAWTTAV